MSLISWLRLATPITVVLLLVSLSPAVHAGQYYEENTSGTGSTTGTAMYYTTWPSTALLPPESPSNPCQLAAPYCAAYHDPNNPVVASYTNESAWIYNGRSAIEVGFLYGWASGTNGGWSTVMLPYYTLNDGVPQVNATANYALPTNTTIWVAAIVCQNGHNANVQVNNWVPYVGCYAIPTPRTNYAQGETLYGDDQMGGGGTPGPVQSMLYQPGSQYPNGWAYWGSMKCEWFDGSGTYPYEPFDYTSTCNVGGSPHQWSNGGGGNGDFGS